MRVWRGCGEGVERVWRGCGGKHYSGASLPPTSKGALETTSHVAHLTQSAALKHTQ